MRPLALLVELTPILTAVSYGVTGYSHGSGQPVPDWAFYTDIASPVVGSTVSSGFRNDGTWRGLSLTTKGTDGLRYLSKTASDLGGMLALHGAYAATGYVIGGAAGLVSRLF